MKQPNILLITDDQHRWDFFDNRTVGCLRTPNLDRLRREGTTLTNAVSNCPICMPTRFTWAYGLYASQVGAGLLRNSLDWPTDLPSMPQALQAAGYYTALVGKLHSMQGLVVPRDVCAEEPVTRGRGFDHVHEVCGKSLAYWYRCNWTRHLGERGLLQTYLDDAKERIEMIGGVEHGGPSPLTPADSMDGYIGGKAREWLAGYEGAQPFFFHASFCGPHFPIDPPEEYHRRYRPEDMPLPEGHTDPAKDAHWQRRRAAYCAMIEQIDEEVGRLLDLLDEKGLRDNTLVLFTTDHGDMMGHHGRGHKGTAYDTSVRTPLIARLPGRIAADRELETPVEAVDLPVSILAAAGIEEPIHTLLPHSPGRSWFAHLTDNAPPPRAWAYSECGPWRMARSPDWKYIYHPDEEDELFDLTADPWECDNRIDRPEQAAILATMRYRLMQSLSASVAPQEPPRHA